jgi:hypothetical protein
MRIQVALAVLGLLLPACGKDAPAPSAGTTAPPAHTHETGPNGGEVQDLEDGYHLEILHDHDGGNLEIWVLGKDAKTTLAVKRPVVGLTTKAGPAEVALTAVDPKPDGTARSWKGGHEALRTDPWDFGRVRVEIEGRQYQAGLEGPAHAHSPAMD